MFTHPAPLAFNSQDNMLPVCPDTETVVLPPEQNVATAADAEPPTEIGDTFTVAELEYMGVHTPLCILARNWYVPAEVSAGLVILLNPAFPIDVKAPPLKFHSQSKTVPVWPLKLIAIVLLIQTVGAAAVAVPPTVVGLTVTEALASVPQQPLLLALQ